MRSRVISDSKQIQLEKIRFVYEYEQSLKEDGLNQFIIDEKDPNELKEVASQLKIAGEFHTLSELRDAVQKDKIDCMILSEKELIKRLLAQENEGDMLMVLSG